MKKMILKKTKIYGNLLIERPFQKCDKTKSFSSRKNILGENAGKKSSLMGSFFESCKKNEDNNDTASNSEELISLMAVKNEIDHNKFIEKIRDNENEEEDKDEDNTSMQALRKGSWFKKMPTYKDDDFKENK